MNRISTVFASALLFCLVAPVYAQQQDQGARPDATTQQEEPRRAPQAAPRQEPPETAPPQQERKQEPQAKPEKQEKQEKQESPKESREQPKANPEEHGQSAQKGQAKVGGKGGHIPDSKFKASFGRQHRFAVNRVITTTTIVPQQTQFVYSGVTFVFVDPWPAGWAFTDDCYIDYVDDEYFLFDELHPGVQVALLVVE
ncbi:MAG TPA: hypothetical protein VJQ82_15345 [Terriglobales bacterium]|nr:hypothetical protein [Terriglobales bacterium]